MVCKPSTEIEALRCVVTCRMFEDKFNMKLKSLDLI